MKKMGNEKWQTLSSKSNTTSDEFRRETYTERGLEGLAVAVVKSAIDEYRYYGYKLKTAEYKYHIKEITRHKYIGIVDDCKEEMRKLLLFFKSEKFKHLCTLDWEWTVKELDSQIEQFDPALVEEQKKLKKLQEEVEGED